MLVPLVESVADRTGQHLSTDSAALISFRRATSSNWLSQQCAGLN